MADRSQVCACLEPATVAAIEQQAAQWHAPLGRAMDRLIRCGLQHPTAAGPSDLVLEAKALLEQGIPLQSLINGMRDRHRLNRRQIESLITEAQSLETPMTLPTVLNAGDGLTIKREAALAAARHVVAATALILDEEPLSETGMEAAFNNLAYMLGGEEWTAYANALMDVVEEEMGR